MNVHPLVKRLQEIASQTNDSFELMVLAKAIEKIKVGAVRTVATFGDLPTLPLAEDGELFLVEADEDLYFNVGSTWDRFRPFVFDAMSWGDGIDGELGDGTRTNRSSPVTVIGGITNWSQVSAGRGHSLGLTSDGIVYAWGDNLGGGIGDGTNIFRSSPVTVVGGIANWSSVSAGESHNLGIANGVAYAWGSNSTGTVGDGTRTNRSSPVTVVGGITNWAQVSAGGQHSLGVTDTGIAYAWGFSGNGQRGDGEVGGRSSPATVVGGIANWSSVSAGSFHSLGIANGIAYAWGNNADGKLGDGSPSFLNRSSPVTVVGGITNWSQVSAGGFHSLGLTADGILYAWGNGTQQGTGYTLDRSSPVTVLGGITNWSQVSAGHNFSLGVTDTGIAYAWGFGISGRLGDGTSVNKSSPVTVVGGNAQWSQVSAGHNHSLAIKSQ